jgi:hypothetical protein
VALAAGLLLSLVPSTAEAQTLSRVREQTELGVSSLTTWKRDGGSWRRDADFRQWVALPFRGYFLDPRIFGYDFSLRPVLTQQFSEGVDQPLRSQQLGWDASLRLLSTAPVAVTLSTSQASGSSAGAFGSRGDFSVGNFTALANFAVPYLPLKLGYASRSTENTWFSGTTNTPVAWSDNTKTLRFSAQNSKLEVNLERMWFDDRIGNRDFLLDRGTLRHQFRWGKGSRLQTLLDRSDRRGTAMYMRQAWQENLHVQHTVGTATDLYIRRFGTATAQGTSSEQSLGGRFNSRVSSWLTLGVRGSSRKTRYNGTRESVLSLSPEINTSIVLPLGARLSVGGMFGFERRDLERVDGASIPVLNEEHIVPETRSFTLEQAGADSASVVIRSADELLEYISGVDYVLVEVDRRVEVLIPLESRIEVGETLLVSYVFTPVDLPEGDLYIGRGTATLAFWRVSVTHAQSLRRSRDRGFGSRIDDGSAAAVLGTMDEMYTALSANVPTPLGVWELELSRRSRESSAIDFESFEGETSLALPTGPSLRLLLGAAARGTRDMGGWVSSRSAYTSLNWRIFRLTRLVGRLQAWELDLSDGLKDRSVGGDMNLSFQVGATEAWIRYQFNIKTEPSPFRVHGLQVRLVRRF